MKTKICTKCKIPLPVSDFYKNKYMKLGLDSWCKGCHTKSGYVHYKKYPWKGTLSGIKKRCNNKNYPKYHRYGGRGIQCLITAEELKKLWFRDKAYLMKVPSIDREDNDGHYEYGNCSYIERSLNSSKDKGKTVYQYDLDGNFIKEWCSQSEAGRALEIPHQSISHCCKGDRKSTGGFKWKHIRRNNEKDFTQR